jgi:osmotically-inducible protein OsmY
MSNRKKMSLQLLALLLSLAIPLLWIGGCASANKTDEEIQMERDRAEFEDLDKGLKDAGITAKVRTGLATDERVSAFEVDVETREGVVILQGAVDRVGDKATAEEIARATEGVSGVVNRIIVGSGESSAT